MKALLYCNKMDKDLYYNDYYKKYCVCKDIPYQTGLPILNGKVVAEIEYDVEDLIIDCDAETITTKSIQEPYEVLRRAKTCDGAVLEYLRGHKGKAYIIKSIKIFDNPYTIDYLTHTDWEKYVDECVRRKGWCNRCHSQKNPKQWIGCSKGRVKTPISYIKVLDTKGQESLLLTSDPEELCRILNGKQTIIIRKR